MNPETLTDVDPWLAVEAGCAEALVASRQVLTGLETGATAAQLVPLLQRERDAVEGLRSGLLAVPAVPGPGALMRRDGVLSQLSVLMETDARSRRLLSQRGVPLRARRRRGA